MDLIALRARCPELREPTADDDAYSIEAFGASISIGFDRDGSMMAVVVRGGGLRTLDGLGPGSSVADLRALGEVKEVYLCDGAPAGVVYRARPMFAFWFHHCNATRAIWHLDVPDTTRVLEVEVMAPGGV